MKLAAGGVVERTGEVVLAGVTRRRGTFALSLDLSLRRGTTVLLGANGAGKSTLLRILATVEQADEGTYFLHGRSVRHRNGRRYARSVTGWLPQVFGYDPGAKAIDYLRYVGWLRGLRSSNLERACWHSLGTVGLRDQAHQRMRELSGGMIRRVGIAQAVVADPALILLDEPTAGLDPNQRDNLYDVIRGVSHDRVVICATHLIEDVQQLADHVVVLAEGSASLDMPYRELIERVGSADVRGHIVSLMRAGRPSNGQAE